MKNFFKRYIFIIFIILMYMFQAFTLDVEAGEACMYFLTNIASVLFLYLIKNKYIALIASLLPVIVMEFVDPECKYFSVIPILLICAHKDILSEMFENETKNKKSERLFSDLITQLCLFLSVAFMIYSLVLSVGTKFSLKAYVHRSMFLLIWLILLFVFSIVDSHKRKNDKKVRKHFFGKLRFLYLVSVIALLATLFYCCTEHSPITYTKYVFFFPWVLFICSMFYNSDPYIKAISDKLESTLSKTPDKK